MRMAVDPQSTRDLSTNIDLNKIVIAGATKCPAIYEILSANRSLWRKDGEISLKITLDNFINYRAAKIISEPDKGIYDALNKGIDNATSEYLIFMNAGDMFASSDALEQISVLTNDKPDFIYGDSKKDNQ